MTASDLGAHTWCVILANRQNVKVQAESCVVTPSGDLAFYAPGLSLVLTVFAKGEWVKLFSLDADEEFVGVQFQEQQVMPPAPTPEDEAIYDATIG